MSSIYVTAAELNGRFTGRPQSTLLEMMVTAARRALEAAALEPTSVDALFAGAMGNFPPEGFVGPIPIRLVNALELRHADVTPMLVGSSEAGAWALRQAYQTMRWSTDYRHVLVVAGEQMNRVAGDGDDRSLADRQARNRAISEILDEQERRYGLNMLRMGDLMVDAVRAIDGWEPSDLRDGLLPLIAVTKYQRVADYPCGHLHGKVSPSLAFYRSRPQLTTWFNLHDVTPTSSGAVALVLSRTPSSKSLEILGMGQAVEPVSLAARHGDPRQSRAVRQALSRACREADVDLQWLRGSDFALVHDAFPSIEYIFLKELGLTPGELLDRIATGWSNPFGGLKACGHALGASGLLQVAKAYHRVFKSERYLTEASRQRLPDASRCFATSVGGPLTHVVVSVLQRHEATSVDTAPGARSKVLNDAYDGATDESLATWEGFRKQIPAGLGLVLAATHIHEDAAFGDDTLPLFVERDDPWVLWCEVGGDRGAAGPKAFAYAQERPDDGELVRLVPERIGGSEYLRAERTGRHLALPELNRPAVGKALRVALKRRLAPYS